MDTKLLFGLEFPVDRHIKISDHFHSDIGFFTFISDELLDEFRFEEVVQSFPKEIYRAKGFVRFRNGSRLFNFVAGRWDMEEMETDRTQLVFIGQKGIREVQEKVLEQLKKCEVSNAL